MSELKPIKVWTVVDKDGRFQNIDCWSRKSIAESERKGMDKHERKLAPFRVELAVVMSAAALDAIKLENNALRSALQALVDAHGNGFHPMKSNGAEWFNARQLLAKGDK